MTWAHHAILCGEKQQTLYALGVTIILAIIFTGLQGLEYVRHLSVSLMVFIGVYFPSYWFPRIPRIYWNCLPYSLLIPPRFGHFTPSHHFGFEAAAWYWHFVDVVWLFLFVSIYWWGGQ